MTYPNNTLINATYINEGDDVMYEYGTYWFSKIPEGATVLVQNAGKDPLQGCICLTDDGLVEQFETYNNGVVGFEYQSGNMDIALFANVLNHKIHQTDEFTFISNFIFSRSLSAVAYEGVQQPENPEPDNPDPKPDPKPGDSGTCLLYTSSWSWTGGHADGGRDLLAVAMREVTEETGLRRLAPVTEGIFSLECLTVDGHETVSYTHLDVYKRQELSGQISFAAAEVYAKDFLKAGHRHFCRRPAFSWHRF